MADLRDYRRKRDPKKTPGAVRRRHIPQGADLRDPAPRRPAAPLRPAARAERRPRELGRPERAPAPVGRASPRGARRGPPPRLRDVRGRHPGRAVRGGHRRDLGPRDVRAPRGETRRRPHRPSPRRACPGGLDARPGAPRRRRAELAAPPEGRADRRRTGASSPARPARRAAPEGQRLALRAEVGRVPGDRHRRRRRGDPHEPQRHRPHRAVPRHRPRGSAGRPHALGGDRRGGLCARRGRHRPLRGAPERRRAADPDGVRPALHRRRAGSHATARGATEAPRGAARPGRRGGPHVARVRRRRRAARRGEGAGPGGGRRQARRRAVQAGPTHTRVAEGEASRAGGLPDRRLHPRNGSPCEARRARARPA